MARSTSRSGSVWSCSPRSAAPSTRCQKDDATKRHAATTTSADLPEIKAPDDIDKISITNADKGEIVLEKKGDKWDGHEARRRRPPTRRT